MVLAQGFARSAPPVTGRFPRVRAVNSTTNTATATANIIDTRRKALSAAVDRAYLNHWIRRQSGENAALVADLALRGKRLPGYCQKCHWSREIGASGTNCRHLDRCLHNLTMPSIYNECESYMTAVQLRTARHIAKSFGHLWTRFDHSGEWADHHNMGHEDGWNSSNHPLPTSSDVTASQRYLWDVDRWGTITFEVNRPAGTACRIIGTLQDFVIEITKLALDRHLVCLFQQLQQVFGLTPDEAIDRIETTRTFALTGIRGGELYRVVMTA